MQTYKATNGINTYINTFNDLLEAETAFASLISQGYIISIIDTNEQIFSITPEKKLQSDLQFGDILIKEFLKDNRLIVPIVTPTESLQLLSQFENVEKLARLGDIKSVNLLLQNIQTDIRLFTDERKNKYLELIQNHINSYG